MLSLLRSVRRLWTPDFRNPFDAILDARLILYQQPRARSGYHQHGNSKSNFHDESIEIEQTLQLIDKPCGSDWRLSEDESITQCVRNVELQFAIVACQKSLFEALPILGRQSRAGIIVG